jgi:hypothetical protein
MSAGVAHKGGKKNRKWGRNKIKCQRYALERRGEKNKVKKLKKHLRHHPEDVQAKSRLTKLA